MTSLYFSRDKEYFYKGYGIDDFRDIFREWVGTTLDEHPNLVLPQGILIDKNVLWFKYRKHKIYSDQEKFNCGQIIQIMRDMACGIGQLHEAGIIHRDIKPGNMCFIDEGKSMRAAIIDFNLCLNTNFGIAGSKLYETVITWPYRPPEIWRMSNNEITNNHEFSIDIFALGMSMTQFMIDGFYEKIKKLIGIDDEFLFGEEENKRLEEDFESKFERVPDLFRDGRSTRSRTFLTKIIKLCINVDPKKRPSAKELVDMIDNFRRPIKIRNIQPYRPAGIQWRKIKYEKSKKIMERKNGQVTFPDMKHDILPSTKKCISKLCEVDNMYFGGDHMKNFSLIDVITIIKEMNN